MYVDGKVLHRDIPENNIIITDPKEADGFKVHTNRHGPCQGDWQ